MVKWLPWGIYQLLVLFECWLISRWEMMTTPNYIWDNFCVFQTILLYRASINSNITFSAQRKSIFGFSLPSKIINILWTDLATNRRSNFMLSPADSAGSDWRFVDSVDYRTLKSSQEVIVQESSLGHRANPQRPGDTISSLLLQLKAGSLFSFQ